MASETWWRLRQHSEERHARVSQERRSRRRTREKTTKEHLQRCHLGACDLENFGVGDCFNERIARRSCQKTCSGFRVTRSHQNSRWRFLEHAFPLPSCNNHSGAARKRSQVGYLCRQQHRLPAGMQLPFRATSCEAGRRSPWSAGVVSIQTTRPLSSREKRVFANRHQQTRGGALGHI